MVRFGIEGRRGARKVRGRDRMSALTSRGCSGGGRGGAIVAVAAPPQQKPVGEPPECAEAGRLRASGDESQARSLQEICIAKTRLSRPSIGGPLRRDSFRRRIRVSAIPYDRRSTSHDSLDADQPGGASNSTRSRRSPQSDQASTSSETARRRTALRRLAAVFEWTTVRRRRTPDGRRHFFPCREPRFSRRSESAAARSGVARQTSTRKVAPFILRST